MRRAINIKEELGQIETVEALTGVFEGIASMRIAGIRGRVVASKAFFTDLWQIYSSLRVNPRKRLKSGRARKGTSVAVVITSESKFGGGMNDKIIEIMLASRGNTPDSDIITVGAAGMLGLKRRHIKIKHAFSLPARDDNINLSAVIQELETYEHISVFYQTYDSLRVQKVTHIDLISTVRELGADVGDGTDTLSSEDYIFEPDINEIADYMESVMMEVALTQIVMEAKLADYASRYNSMSIAKKRAGESVSGIKHEYHRAKRGESDERLKEVMKAFKHRSTS